MPSYITEYPAAGSVLAPQPSEKRGGQTVSDPPMVCGLESLGQKVKNTLAI